MVFVGSGCMWWCSILFKTDIVWSAMVMCSFHVQYLDMRLVTKRASLRLITDFLPIKSDRGCCWLPPACLGDSSVWTCGRTWRMVLSPAQKHSSGAGELKGSRQVLDVLINDHWAKIWATNRHFMTFSCYPSSKCLCISYIKKVISSSNQILAMPYTLLIWVAWRQCHSFLFKDLSLKQETS